MSKWAGQSATELASAIQNKQVGSRELLEYFIERYERLNPKINAVVYTDLETARRRADDADEALAKGELWGPLHGLPMTLKDNLQFAGMPMTMGSPALKDFFPPKNQDVVQAVLDAGAVVYGKTNLPYLGMDTQSFNELYGQTNNPWDLETTPGGSSGGSAAALAAGLCALEIGNDIGGSIRFPAHFCGIYGHKPSYGIVPTSGGVLPMSGGDNRFQPPFDLVVQGPLARSAEDLRLAMDILVAPLAHQKKAFKIELPESRQQSLGDFKVGTWFSHETFPTDNETTQVIAEFVGQLKNAGIQFTDQKPEVDLERSHDLRNIFEMIGLSHIQPPPVVEQYKALQDSDDPAMKQAGDTFFTTHRDASLLEMERFRLRQQWEDYFQNVDVLLCPVSRIAAHPHDHTPIFERSIEVDGNSEPYWQVMGPWNSLALVAYLPSTVVPVGRTPDGRPVGVQIIGPYLEDLTTIQFAIELQKALLGPFVLPQGFEA